MKTMYRKKVLQIAVESFRKTCTRFASVTVMPGLGSKQCFIQRKAGWESAIGLEIHAQISSESKIFSHGATTYGSPVNTLVSYLDSAIPGTLPVLNEHCVRAAILTAMALSCEISGMSTFDRKHYFYADLPAGYQITQQRNPLGKKGEMNFMVYTPGIHKAPYEHKCKIIQLQLEQDSGKSLHDGSTQMSLIDLNRAGIGLMEIVFEPHLRDGEEAAALVKELILILEAYQTCNCKMEEGSLRVDANVSVNRENEPLGVRTEVKNLGSIRSVANAVEFEVQRQIAALESGGTVINETRSFDVYRKQTVPMRDKEVKQDYRFMPEPNLPPLRLSYNPSDRTPGVVNIVNLRKDLKELPEVTRRKLVKQYGIRFESAIIIVNQPGMLSYYKDVMKSLKDNLGVRAVNLLLGPLLELLNENSLDYTKCPIPADKVSEIITLLAREDINAEKAEEVLKILVKSSSKKVSEIVQEENMLQVNDDSKIKAICHLVLVENAKLAENYKGKDKPKMFKKLMSAVHKKGEGRLNMKKASDFMTNVLEDGGSVY